MALDYLGLTKGVKVQITLGIIVQDQRGPREAIPWAPWAV